jgi:diadenosine tetraphosphate (Ap4A) HIT family hydrolase
VISNKITAENALTVMIRGGFSVSPGLILIISKRHIASIFEAAEDERAAS